MGYQVPSVNQCYDFTCVIGQLQAWCCSHAPLVQSVYDECKGTSLSEQVAYLFGVVRDVVKTQQCVDENFKTLYDFVKDFFENLDLQEEVNEWLNEFLTSGKLEELLNDTILQKILQNTNEVLHNQPFVYRGDQYENLKDAMFTSAASFLVNSVGCPCVEGTPTGRNTPFIAKYNDGNTYMGLLGQGEFVYTDKENWEEQQYPVVYLDCSGFVSLMTKGRTYTNSPYYKAFNGTTNVNTLITYAREIGSYFTDEYTVDFLERIVTFGMAQLLNTSGCPLHQLSTYNVNSKQLNVDSNELSLLKTGDIIFNASSHLTNRYRGIHHCAIYIKSMDELNPYGIPYNVTFKPLLHDEDDEKYGYLIHCDNDEGAPSVLKIETLYHRMKSNITAGSTEIIYYSTPVHNAFNSSKSYYLVTGMLNSYENTYNIGRWGGAYARGYNVRSPIFMSEDNTYNIYSLITNDFRLGRGIALTADANLNSADLNPSVYFCDSASIAATIAYTPWTDRSYQLYYLSRLLDGENSRYGFMVAVNTPTSGAVSIKVRSCGYNGYWTEWATITTS